MRIRRYYEPLFLENRRSGLQKQISVYLSALTAVGYPIKIGMDVSGQKLIDLTEIRTTLYQAFTASVYCVDLLWLAHTTIVKFSVEKLTVNLLCM